MCLAVRAEDGSLIGVLSVDFLLKDVTDYLEHLKKEFQGDTLVFSIHGQILASPKDLNAAPIIEKIREKLAVRDDYEKVHSEGGRLIMEIPLQGDTYFAGVRCASVPGDLDCVSTIIFSRKEAFGALDAIIYHGILTALVALGFGLREVMQAKVVPFIYFQF